MSKRQRGLPVNGDLLRSLRLARKWSQEQAAHLAGVSDRLIRKAESSMPIDARSLDALAVIYSDRSRILTPADLITFSDPNRNTRNKTSTCSLLVNWIVDVWERGLLETLDRNAELGFTFHCELGTLTSSTAVKERFERIHQSFGEFSVMVDYVAQVGNKSVCRWRLLMTHLGIWHGIEPTGRRLSTIVTTTSRIVDGKIEEYWEYWQSQPVYHELARQVPI